MCVGVTSAPRTPTTPVEAVEDENGEREVRPHTQRSPIGTHQLPSSLVIRACRCAQAQPGDDAQEYASLVATLKKFENAFKRRYGCLPKYERDMAPEYVAAHKRRRELQAEFPGLKRAHR